MKQQIKEKNFKKAKKILKFFQDVGETERIE